MEEWTWRLCEGVRFGRGMPWQAGTRRSDGASEAGRGEMRMGKKDGWTGKKDGAKDAKRK